MSPAPGRLETAGLLLRLRFTLFLRGRRGRGWLGAGLAALLALALSLLLAAAVYQLLTRVPGIRTEPLWTAFSLALLSFLLGVFWILWPVVAAHIDESSELRRFQPFPVRPGRLYLVHTLVALVEPAALFFYPLLAGLGLGVYTLLGGTAPLLVVCLLAFAWMNVAGGRFMQNLFLNLMSSRRSGEMLAGGFLLLLGLAALLPPVDVSWLTDRLQGISSSPRDLNLLLHTTRALARTPPGWLAVGLTAAAAGLTGRALAAAALMVVAGALAWVLGLLLLKRYSRGGRGWQLLPARRPSTRLRPGRFAGPITLLLMRLELGRLLGNPKARLTFAVPFFLLILLKILGGVELARYLWGSSWAALLWTVLGAYQLAVFAGQFLVNGFGYDGPAVRLLLLQPLPLRRWLCGRNLAQAAFALLQFAGLGILVLLMPGAGGRALVLPLAGFPFALFLCLAAGNRLSILHPRRFHFDLSRRDRPPAGASAAMLALLAGCGLVVAAMLVLAGGSWTRAGLLLAPLPVLGLGLWLASLSASARLLHRQRERLLHELVSD